MVFAYKRAICVIINEGYIKRKYTFVKCSCDVLRGTPKAQCYDKICNSFSKLYQCHRKAKESFFLVFYFSYQPILFVCLLCIYLYIWKMCLVSFFSFCLITLITIFPNSKEYFSSDTNSRSRCKRSSWACFTFSTPRLWNDNTWKYKYLGIEKEKLWD